MLPDKALDNIAVSIVWALAVALLTTPDFGFEAAVLFGLAVGVFVSATQFLVMDREFEAETAKEINAYVWGFGIAVLVMALCRVFVSTLYI